MDAVITATGLVKTFAPAKPRNLWHKLRRAGTPVSTGKTAVAGISFTVKPGTCTGLLGPNGAGKTTTMRMLMGLTPRTAGTLDIFGSDAAHLSATQRQRLSLVPQDDNLDPDLTVFENLYVYGRFFGLKGASLKARVTELLAHMQLTEKTTARVNQLSGGMKRRLTIARALINNPDLIILDEPTTGLDPQARINIWQRILELKKQGKTLLLTTHYMDEAQRLCDHIILIDDGRILDEGAPRALISKHVKPHVFDITKPSNAADTAALRAALPPVPMEDLGDSVVYYVDDAAAFRRAIPETAQFLQRPANMEDVFLTLTGRTLRH